MRLLEGTAAAAADGSGSGGGAGGGRDLDAATTNADAWQTGQILEISHGAATASASAESPPPPQATPHQPPATGSSCPAGSEQVWRYVVVRDPPTVYSIGMPSTVIANASEKLVLVPQVEFVTAAETQWKVWYEPPREPSLHPQAAPSSSSSDGGGDSGGESGTADNTLLDAAPQVPTRGPDVAFVGTPLVLNVEAGRAGHQLVCECTAVKSGVAGDSVVRAVPIDDEPAGDRPWLTMRSMMPATGALPYVGAGDQSGATGVRDADEHARADAVVSKLFEDGSDASRTAAIAALLANCTPALPAADSSAAAVPESSSSGGDGSTAGSAAADGAESSGTTPNSAPASFRVMSYNLLADMYVSRPGAHEAMYPYCDPKFLSRSYRKQMLFGEMLQYNADILCCQEVEGGGYKHFFEPSLNAAGYAGVHAPKGNAKNGQIGEGCATFWKESQFECISTSTVQFADVVDDPQYADLFNPYLTDAATAEPFRRVTSVAQMTLLAARPNPSAASPGEAASDAHRQSTSSSSSAAAQGRSVLVLNTHLYYHPAAPHIRLLHLGVLLDKAAETLAAHPGASLLLCGDLNSTPETGLVEYLWNGTLSPAHREWSHGFKFRWETQRGYAPGDGAAKENPDTVSKEPRIGSQRRGNLPVKWASATAPGSGAAMAAETGDGDISVPQSGPQLVHPFKFTMPHSLDEMTGNASVYGAEFCGWIDYVAASNGITVASAMPPMPEAAISWGGTSFLPSKYFPSDHVPIVTTCSWDERLE